MAYDPAYAYELAVIIHDGMRRMFQQQEAVFYYLTMYNETYPQPAMPAGVAEGILKGMYRLNPARPMAGLETRPQLLGSGPILREVLRAQQILAERFEVETDVWSVTSYGELRRDALAVDRWNLLHPEEEPRICHVLQSLGMSTGPIVAATDFVRLVPEQIARWVPGRMVVLGTDGFGRSDTRSALRRHFGVDAEHIAFATLSAMSRLGHLPEKVMRRAIAELPIDREATHD